MFSGLSFNWTSSTVVGYSRRGIFRSTVLPLATNRTFGPNIKSSRSFKSTLSGHQSSTPRQIPASFGRRSCLQSRLFQISHRHASKILSDSKVENLGLGARLKKLSREYGWSAFAVYLALSALDFPLCYLLVSYLGADKIGDWELAVVSIFKRLIPENIQKIYNEWQASRENAVEKDPNPKLKAGGHGEPDESVKSIVIGAEEARHENKKDAGLATQLALAYAIHKTFIFVRVPLTAALTPRFVRMLRGWGWDIGKRTSKRAKLLKRAASSIKARVPRTSKRK